jgi:hypothetical protein
VRRDLFVTSVLAVSVFGVAVPAGAGTSSHASSPRSATTRPVTGVSVAAEVRSAARPAAQVLSNFFTGDTCVYLSVKPNASTECVAVGGYNSVRPGKIVGQVQVALHHRWSFAGSYGTINSQTQPAQVSCARDPEERPRCLFVGSHFPRSGGPVVLAEWSASGRFTTILNRAPAGMVKSELNDVSCPKPTFCVMVGSAETRPGPSVAIAYTWTNGTKLATLSLPSPPNASTMQLSGISCASPTACLAVGNYNTTSGKPLPYAVSLRAGKWRISKVPPVKGTALTNLNGVSCGAPADCIAVGYTAEPGFAAFAERFRNGSWRTMRIVPQKHSEFLNISCTAGTRYCVAVGRVNNISLIEAYKTDRIGGHLRGRWIMQPVPRLAGSPDIGLADVSCLSRNDCTAVGDRGNPKISESFRTLAMRWNGTIWVIQPTINK